MAKQGRKLRNRSSTPDGSDVDGSEVKNKTGSHSKSRIEADVTSPHADSATRRASGTISASMESFDNVHSPFFLHAADHPGLSIVSHILDGTNYNNWYIAMRISLDAKNKLAFVDGSLPRPDVSDNLFKIWSRCNSMVKAWVMNVVNQEIYDSILYYEDAAEMWNDLYMRFRVSNLPRKYQLEQSIYNLKQGSLDLSTYFTKKKTLWEQLANTKTHSAKRCDCDHVKELIDDAETSKIIQFLMGLNDGFANIRGQILNMRPRPGLSEIYNMLDQDESQRVVGLSNRITPAPAAFQVQESTISDSSQILLAHGNFKKPKCSHCHKIGHTVDKCYKVHGFPPGHHKARSVNNVGTTNMATINSVPVLQQEQKLEISTDQFQASVDNMSKDQIQNMISFFSSKLHTPSNIPPPANACASSSNSAPVISSVSGNYSGIDDWSR